jgi:hypothetical protein
LETTFDTGWITGRRERGKIAALKKKKAFGGRLLIGAGTVLNEEDSGGVDRGDFIISPNTTSASWRAKKSDAYHPRTPRLRRSARPGHGRDIVSFPADDLGFHNIQNLRGPLPTSR